VEVVIVVTAGAAMGFVVFSVVVRGDAVAFFRPFTWFVPDAATCFRGFVLVGRCLTAPDEELRGVEVTGAGSGSGDGVCAGAGAEVLADGSGSGAGACCTVVVPGR
jgi:hypothetical protein